MDALMRIEGFRSLNADIETIINKSNEVKKAKKEGQELTQKQKKELTDAEKEYKSKRKMIQEKLIKFATRVPVFMYLTDYREYSLQDVITQLEPELFKKVTGLDVKDFELLVSLNVFNEGLMNQAVWQFKRYEDASLIYTGIDKHTGENVGLYSTVISRADYDAMAGQLAASMAAEAPKPDDIPDRPVFTNIGPDEEDEDETEQSLRGKGALGTDKHSTPGRPPIVQSAGSQSGGRTGSQISGTQTGRAASGNQTSPASGYQTNRPASGQQGTRRNGKVEIIQPAGPAIGNTYRPAYIPPKPSAPPTTVKPKATVDTSKIHAGTIVTHKAFGPGQVKGIDSGLIVVTFNGTDKKFQFPGAFEQGFLRLI